MENADAKQIVKANSIWVLVDPRTERPIRITDEVSSHYPDEPKLEMDYCDRKIEIPKEYKEMPGVVVAKYFIDTNVFLSNAKLRKIYIILIRKNLCFNLSLHAI